MIDYSKSLSLDCPHCLTKTQFLQMTEKQLCKEDNQYHLAYTCTYCRGGIIAIFSRNIDKPFQLQKYYPQQNEWRPKVNLLSITNDNVKKDFQEAINCYNCGLYNSSMVMSRRAIHQEMIKKKLSEKFPNNLYKQIENSGISPNLIKLLNKVKNFGNHGAHPDYVLYDTEGKEINDKKKFAKLSLDFLDKYFSDEYEIDSLIRSAPNSKEELTL